MAFHFDKQKKRRPYQNGFHFQQRKTAQSAGQTSNLKVVFLAHDVRYSQDNELILFF